MPDAGSDRGDRSDAGRRPDRAVEGRARSSACTDCSASLPWTLPDGGRLGAPARSTLTATYLDTPDLRLARWRVSLRRREGGSDEGWHLKLPLRAETREELTFPLNEGSAPHRPMP